MRHYPANLNRPSWQWSARDWLMFKAFSHSTPRQIERSRQIMIEILSGKTVAEVAVAGKISRQYVYQVLALEELKNTIYHARRRSLNLGRPIDMGGPRDVWIED